MTCTWYIRRTWYLVLIHCLGKGGVTRDHDLSGTPDQTGDNEQLKNVYFCCTPSDVDISCPAERAACTTTTNQRCYLVQQEQYSRSSTAVQLSFNGFATRYLVCKPCPTIKPTNSSTTLKPSSTSTRASMGDWGSTLFVQPLNLWVAGSSTEEHLRNHCIPG